MGYSLPTYKTQVSAWDSVEFVGPSSPVLSWPAPMERGVVTRVQAGQGSALVVWQHTTAVLAWPVEWVRRADEPSSVAAEQAPGVDAA
jgi:hypothetical protein